MVSTDFVTLPNVAKTTSLAFVPRSKTVARVHVEVRRALASCVEQKTRHELREQGIYRCPCEIDLALSSLLDRFAHRPAYSFDYFVEPPEPRAIRLDVDVRRSRDGQRWTAQTLIRDCRTGSDQSKTIDESFGERLQLRMRFVAQPTHAPMPVRVSRRKPVMGGTPTAT